MNILELENAQLNHKEVGLVHLSITCLAQRHSTCKHLAFFPRFSQPAEGSEQIIFCPQWSNLLGGQVQLYDKQTSFPGKALRLWSRCEKVPLVLLFFPFFQVRLWHISNKINKHTLFMIQKALSSGSYLYLLQHNKQSKQPPHWNWMGKIFTFSYKLQIKCWLAFSFWKSQFLNDDSLSLILFFSPILFIMGVYCMRLVCHMTCCYWCKWFTCSCYLKPHNLIEKCQRLHTY